MFHSESMKDLFESVIEKVRKRETFSPLYRTLTRTLTPAQTTPEEINLAGFYFQVIDAASSATFINVRFNEESADPVPVRKGDEIVTPFYRLFIDWPAQAGTLTFVVSPLFDLWRINRTAEIAATLPLPTAPGPDHLNERAQAGFIFERAANLTAAVGQFPHIQCLNPAGSGKTVVVWGLHFGMQGTIGTWFLGSLTNVLTSLHGTFNNVIAGGAASTAELRSQSVAGIFPTTIYRQWRDPLERIVSMRGWWVLNPGQSLTFVVQGANGTLHGGFSIWEF